MPHATHAQVAARDALVRDLYAEVEYLRAVNTVLWTACKAAVETLDGGNFTLDELNAAVGKLQDAMMCDTEGAQPV